MFFLLLFSIPLKYVLLVLLITFLTLLHLIKHYIGLNFVHHLLNQKSNNFSTCIFKQKIISELW